MDKPLAGIRVLDLSRILAGPWCSQHLADLGAEVIKVEHPARGDDTRSWGPPYLEGTLEAAYYLSANRGKQSVAIDISHPSGQQLVRELAAEADVVLENFKVGGLARYGLDYATLKTVKPDLIYCSITGFGQDGPYAERAGYDFLLQGMGGLMSLTGQPEDHPGSEPVKVGVAITDLFTGMYAATAILSALLQRNRTGKGTWIDLSLLDVQVGVLANQAMNYLATGTPPRRLGNTHPNIVPYQVFACADGHIILAVGNDTQFRRFCSVADLPALAEDPAFATNPGRVENREQLIPQLSARIAERPSAFWLEALEAVGVPCGPINNLAQVFADPQIRHRNMRIERPHPEAGTVPLVSNPVRFDGIALNADTAPPALGEHTRDVLQKLLPKREAQLDQLSAEGVIR